MPLGTALSPSADPSPSGIGDEARPRLVVVRHGATEWSRSGRHTGRTDLPLLDDGRVEAEELGRRLAGHRFTVVLTSPLSRARETCAIAGFGSLAEECDDLREWDYGAYEGRTTDEIRAQRPGWSLWRDGVPDGETATEVGDRADRVVSVVRDRSGDVLAFAHAHVLRVLGARWVGLPAEAGALFTLAPATISVLGWEREVAAVTRWNDAAGDPLR
ncbi:MAG TPA: histidine phosphatase family protein [Acidimicrobiales bacterium]